MHQQQHTGPLKEKPRWSAVMLMMMMMAYACVCVCRSRISAFALSFSLSLFFLLIFSRYFWHEHTSSIMGQAKSKENRVLSRKTHCKQPSFLHTPPPSIRWRFILNPTNKVSPKEIRHLRHNLETSTSRRSDHSSITEDVFREVSYSIRVDATAVLNASLGQWK